jgi:hypothetical protein
MRGVRGRRVAHYEVVKSLGAGGMGEVFLARDTRLEREVALKLATIESPDTRARVLREARAASALRHPGIVTVYEIGESEGSTFIAMELVDGQTFSELLQEKGPLPPAEAVALVAQVGDALAAAHDAGILHRDVKCANLMLERGGRVRVLDFGLSKRLEPSLPRSEAPAVARDGLIESDDTTPASSPPTPSSPGAPLTAYGTRMGTPGYAARELERGEDADVRSDVFSLGVVLYELVTGERPFHEPKTWGELERALSAEQYVAAHDRRPGVPAALGAVIARALRARRGDRYPTVRALVEEARAAVRPPRRRWPVVAGAAAMLLLAGGVTMLATRSGSTTPVVQAPDAGPTGLADVAATRAVTHLGGCVYAPAFLDDDTVVFDYTPLDGTASDIYTVKVGSGETRQISKEPTQDLRALPGRQPDEILYVTIDPDNSNMLESLRLAHRNLTTGELTKTDITASTATYAGDSLVYPQMGTGQLRRRRGQTDELLLTLDAGQIESLAGSRDGRWIAAATHISIGKGCLVDLERRTGTCFGGGRIVAGRPTVSAHAMYYAHGEGLGRRDLETGADEVFVPGPIASGGLAVSPNGASLAYSDCTARGGLYAIEADGSLRSVVEDQRIRDATAGPGGLLTYARVTPGASVIVLRQADGTTMQLTFPAGGRATEPTISPDGKRVAFALAGDAPGIYSVDATGRLPASRVTTGVGDSLPIWTSDRDLLFVRDDGGVPNVYRTTADGTEAVRFLSSRLVVDVHHPSGKLLLISDDYGRLFVWDPVTKKERLVPLPKALTNSLINTAMFGPDETVVVQLAGFVSSVWSIPIREPEKARQLYASAPGQSADKIVVDSTGRLLVAPRTWTGELFVIPALPGARF